MAKRTTKTEVVTKALARSGPEIQPNQIRLADEAQTDKTKIFTQTDVNQGMSGGGGGGVTPDLKDYAKTEYVNSANNALNDLIAGNAKALEALEERVQALEARGKTAIHRFDTRLGPTQQGGADTGPSFIRMNLKDLDGNPVDLAEWESAQFIFTYNGQDENFERPILGRDLIEGNSNYGRITFDLPWIDGLHDPPPKCVMTLILK